MDTTRYILEEVVLPEREGTLTSKRYATTATGTVLKETRLAFCDQCGSRINHEKITIICHSCKRKLCTSPRCALDYLGKHYCGDCLLQILPFNRVQFKIIHGLINKLRLNEIRDLARSRNDELRAALNELLIHGYVEKKGVSLFSRYEVLQLGVLAWRTYHAAFCDADVAYFMVEVGNRLKEVNSNEPEKQCGKRC